MLMYSDAIRHSRAGTAYFRAASQSHQASQSILECCVRKAAELGIRTSSDMVFSAHVSERYLASFLCDNKMHLYD